MVVRNRVFDTGFERTPGEGRDLHGELRKVHVGIF